MKRTEQPSARPYNEPNRYHAFRNAAHELFFPVDEGPRPKLSSYQDATIGHGSFPRKDFLLVSGVRAADP
jgi:hypothetical protein